MDNNLVWVNKINDYTHSLSCHDAAISELYQQVNLDHGYKISQTTDAFNKRIMLFWVWK